MALSTETFRRKYAQARLAENLKNASVFEKIVSVDKSGVKYIDNPYITTPTTTVQAIAGTYTAARLTTTNDRLTATDEFIVAVNIPDFESRMSEFDLFVSTIDQMSYSLMDKINSFVVNNLCEDGTGTYTTPAGGFTTAANINEIFGALQSKVAGYADNYNGLFVVVENTDYSGLAQAGATNGFTFADAVLNNGKVGQWMGVDIYIVRTGTFTDATMGTITWTNSGHRVFGVKNSATFLMPSGINYDEKKIDGLTGKQMLAVAYGGFKLWAPKASLIVDITLA